jgi:hypothetical protein
MPWGRSSAVDRHIECPAASWLPRADRGAWQPGYLTEEPIDLVQLGPPPLDDSVLADWGTNMHLAKEGSPLAADPWLSWMEPHRERLWPASLGQHEVPFGLCCRTGLVELWKPQDGDKDIWKRGRPASFITGTMDWWGRLPGGEPWVDDLKTGWFAPNVLCPQMLIYALVASRVTGYPTVRVSITHWRRGWEDEDRKWQQVGPATLEAFEDELRVAYRRAIAPSPEPRPGLWCKYCPSAPVCPAVVGEPTEK